MDITTAPKLKIINIQHRDITKRLFEMFYEMVNDEPVVTYKDLDRTKSSQGIVSLFNQAYTMALLGDELFRLIETLDDNDIPYMIAVWQDKKLWATVSCLEVNY